VIAEKPDDDATDSDSSPQVNEAPSTTVQNFYDEIEAGMCSSRRKWVKYERYSDDNFDPRRLPRELLEQSDEPDIDLQCLFEDLNDLGNARRFIRRYGDQVIYVLGVGWHAWDGKHFIGGPKGRNIVSQCANLTVEDLKKETDCFKDHLKQIDETRKDAENRLRIQKQWARTSGNIYRRNAMIDAAENDLSISVADLNRDPLKLTVSNGTLNLRDIAKTTDKYGKPILRLQPHDPEDRITRPGNVTYDPDADCPKWDAFLEKILPDQKLRDYLQ
jgi:putative DNA primase/helicase